MPTPKLMIVEDERITAEDLKEGLEDLGYDVAAVVYSGEESIKKAEEIKPDLIIMDIKLEGEMDGIEAAEYIRSNYGIPVIYLSAYSDENTVQRAKITEPSGFIRKSPAGFLNKPFEESELHTTIEITLYRDRMEKRLRENERWLTAILTNIADAVIATDSKGQIKFMNPVAEDLTGFIQEDAIGKFLSEVFTILSDGPGKLSSILLNKIFREEVARNLYIDNVILKSKNGTEVPIYGAINPIKDEKGNIIGIVVVFRDISTWIN
ncbi:MAG: response regulator [Methanomicrobiales archaeon]